MFERLNGKSVLVTGASGFIGQHLARRLAGSVDRLVLLTRTPAAIAGLDRPHVVRIVRPMDQLTPAVWRDAGVDGFDIVFHLGSFMPKSPAEANDVDAVYRDNLLATRALLNSLTPRRFVLASTVDVYAPSIDGGVIDESSIVGPAGLYGASKVFIEQLVRVHAHANGYEQVVLRYGHIFGPGEHASRKLVPTTIANLLRGVPPTLFGGGTALRDLLYVDDAVEATVRAAVIDEAASNTVNVVSGESVPIRDIVTTIVRAVGYEGPIAEKRDVPAGHSLRFNAARMKRLLGSWPLVSLAEGLRREVEAFRQLDLSSRA